MRILVADDDLTYCRMLEALLRKWGFEPVVAHDGEEAWKILQAPQAPQLAILGMGKIMEKPIVVGGKIEIRKILPLSLSFDHRVVDGAEAVRFMNTVIELLEDPGLILMEE